MVQPISFGLRRKIDSIRKRHEYTFENGMNKTSVFQRPLLEMKPSSQMSSTNTISSMELKDYYADQEHHGQTELKQQWDCSRDSGLWWPRHWKEMKGLMVLLVEKVWRWPFGPETQLTISGYSSRSCNWKTTSWFVWCWKSKSRTAVFRSTCRGFVNSGITKTCLESTSGSKTNS